ncbi:sulfate ABC transporter permease subunit CysT [Corticibacter populi]|uniref:Sulfate ABC transporter permease subunit CysT n=2 Tax=Corticibacter populi TaxID=1550736 RepID=A0A3M6R1G8_9BURK|nr:sulfate ABC transporter permease subunit CysT [Corticibacter populi]
MGYTLFYLSLIVLIPLVTLFVNTFTLTWEQFWSAVSSPRVVASYKLTFGASLLAALVNLVFGLLIAWVLVRYKFPFKKLIDALVDLPFALPTAVAGISLTALLAPNGWVGQWLEQPAQAFQNTLPLLQQFGPRLLLLSALASALAFALGRLGSGRGAAVHLAGALRSLALVLAVVAGAALVIGLLLLAYGWFASVSGIEGVKVAFTPKGVVVALIFIGLPFVVRTVQPVLEDFEKELEEAAGSLGATRWQTFYKVILPAIVPALLTGFALAFARALGEYGSVIFIAGNMPMVSEITPLIIIGKLEQYDYAGATAVALVMLLFSFLMLFVINGLQAWQRRTTGSANK